MHASSLLQGTVRLTDCERAHVAAPRAWLRVAARMEEFFLHLWDELDDVAGACRHVATSAAGEMLAAAAPLIAAASGALLAGTATLLLSHRGLLHALT